MFYRLVLIYPLILPVILPDLPGIDGPTVLKAKLAPELDAMFAGDEGWIGGDGVYSVVVVPRRILWLFSDTWVGKIRDGRRTDATIVNNTIGVQTEPRGKVNFAIARDQDSKPRALIIPEDKRGWFWIQAGVANQDQLTLFLQQVEKGDSDTAFGFRSVSMWMGTIANAQDRPEAWQVTQKKLTNTLFAPDRTLTWGMATLRIDDLLYIYGIDERRGQGLPDRQMVLARVPLKSVADLTAWRYYQDGTWVTEWQKPTRLAGNMAWEYSVTPLGKRYLAVTTDLGLSPRILGRLADNPWGPWSEAMVLYECPEMKANKKLFTYAAKAHPSLSSGSEVVISYVVNSFDFWQVAREAQLYWPRFVRIRMEN